VSAFQSDNGNSKKQENAQTAVNNLSADSKTLKTDLQNKINASVKARAAAMAKAKADKEAQAKTQNQAPEQAQSTDSSAQVSDSSQANNSNYTAAVQDNSTHAAQPQAGNTAQAPAQTAPSNNGGGNAPAGWQSGTDADSLAKQEEAAQNAGTGNANNKQPGDKW
jgi:hypothetical protein